MKGYEMEGYVPMETAELLECAKINFKNFVKMNPAAGKHAMFVLAMEQLDEAIRRASINESEQAD